MEELFENGDEDRCPFCGSDDVSESSPGKDAMGVFIEMWCLVCEKGVRKEYTLTKTEQI